MRLCAYTPMRLSESKRQLNRDENRDGLAETAARNEAPLLGSLDGFLVETESRIKRLRDVHVAHGTVGQHHGIHPHDALNLGPHGLSGVLRLLLNDDLGQLDTVAGPVHAATSATAFARPKA